MTDVDNIMRDIGKQALTHQSMKSKAEDLWEIKLGRDEIDPVLILIEALTEAIAEERERCAELAEEWSDSKNQTVRWTGYDIAAAIRKDPKCTP